jgi:hypothetical protein
MIKIFSSLRRMCRPAAIVPIAAIVLHASAASAQLLGSAQTFAVLGASTVTATPTIPTIITGDLGVSPGTAITGFPPGQVVGGAIHAGDPVAAQAHTDAVIAYAALAAMACPSTPGGNNLTGQILGQGALLSLPPGVYCFNSSAQLTGTLSLTGAGPWVFKIGSTLTTATASQVVVFSAGASCGGSNVFWQVGSSATLGTGTQFVGNIVALTSITLTTGVTVDGSALALGGAVTMDTNKVSTCSGASGIPPGLVCEMPKGTDDDHKDGKDDSDKDRKDHDGDHKDHDKDHDKDHKDGDRDGKDHESRDR